MNPEELFKVSLVLAPTGVSFGAPGGGGPGGDGGAAGSGGVEGQRWVRRLYPDKHFEETADSFKRLDDGRPGKSGAGGLMFGGDITDYARLQPRVLVCASQAEAQERLMEEDFI